MRSGKQYEKAFQHEMCDVLPFPNLVTNKDIEDSR